MRREVEGSYISAKERLRMLVPGANKLYWERRIEQGKELMDDEIRIREKVARQIAILVERLKEAMKLDCPQASEWAARKAIVDYYEYEP